MKSIRRMSCAALRFLGAVGANLVAGVLTTKAHWGFDSAGQPSHSREHLVI